MLEFEGELQITAQDGGSIDVSASGSRVRAEIGTFSLGRPTLRLVTSSVVLARRLATVLERESITLVITRDGKPVAELGAGVKGGLAARLFRMPRVRMHRRS